MQHPLFPQCDTTLVPFGCQPLLNVLDQQLALVQQVRDNAQRAFILVGEHPPVYTVGKAFKDAVPNTLLNIPVEAVSRGGRLTYHGPGQLVVYPVVSIRAVGGIPTFLHTLERWLGQVLDALGLPTVYPPPCGSHDRPATGVWLQTDEGAKKVASIGLALKHWVSYHGIALNVCNPLMPFHAIDPCGYHPQVMTSLHQQWCQSRPGSLPPSWSQWLKHLNLLERA
jgi:lipoyl(octanoyl) transferase